jgi:hypothetical protein
MVMKHIEKSENHGDKHPVGLSPSNHPPLGNVALGAKPWQGRPSICMTCIDGSMRVLKPKSLQL